MTTTSQITTRWRQAKLPINTLATIRCLISFYLLQLSFIGSSFQATTIIGVVGAKVVDFGSKLPEFIDDHPGKSWLIKFYAPWCYHCQQLEPTYMNVAERIYHNHDNVIVGRVDCTKYGSICEKYGVQSYPTITFLSKNTQVVYKGDRSLDSILNFVARLDGPDIKAANSCEHLKHLTSHHGLVVLLVDRNSSSEYFEKFSLLASALKSNYWFYHSKETCKDFIRDDGLYLLKKHLNKAIKFKTNDEGEDLQKAMTKWISHESFPVYGPINSMNFDRAIATKKLLVIAVLEEYEPAKKFLQSSRDFNKLFERIARRYSQYDERFLFAWSSDLNLIQSIAIGHVNLPNIMIVKPDYSYHLMNKYSDLVKNDNEIPEGLDEKNIKILLASAKLDELTFEGGNSFIFRFMRHIYSQYNNFMSMYSANPLLASILVGLPSIIILFVIYTTCCYDSQNFDNADDDENLEEDEQRLLNHVKQD